MRMRQPHRTPTILQSGSILTTTVALVIGTGKDAGLFVFDLSGNLIQKMFPPNAPQVLLSDPPTPPGLNDTALPCPRARAARHSAGITTSTSPTA